MATITIGDYIYTYTMGSGTASIKVADTSKSSYSVIQSPVIIDGNEYSITDMSYCFDSCTSLTQAPEIPSSVTDMSYCFYNCTSLTGYIVVHNKPSAYTNVFTNTGNLKVVTIGIDNTVYTTWSNIVNNFSNVTMELTYIPCFHIGDYEYRNFQHQDWLTLSVEAIDKSKTSYESITTPIYVANNLKNVNGMVDCFSGCTSLIQPPEIPESIIFMTGCFTNCSSLVTIPSISSNVILMEGCFYGCESLTQAPEIPPNVKDMRWCFYGCESLTQAPEIPSNVKSMNACFYDCTSLTQAPEIPSSVTDMDDCFYNCTSLYGKVLVSSSIFSSSSCFYNTLNPIYLINNTSPKDPNVTTKLRSVASDYQNVHYEADNNPIPVVSGSVLRVTSTDNETQGSGTYAYIIAITNLFTSGLPEGWTVEIGSKTLLMDNINVLTIWQDLGENLTYNSKTWYNTNDLREHTFTLKIADIIRDENGQIVDSRDSDAITIILLKAPAVPFSAYHDKTNNTDGVAVGVLATTGELFEVDWNARFNQDLFLDLDLDTTTLDSKTDVIGDLLFELDVDSEASADTDATSGANMELFNAIRKLGWFNSVITE